MTHSNILVVVVDGLRSSALGAYGNTTYSTQSLDRFAAESLLLDNCYAPSGELAGIYRALWRSLHPARPISSSLDGLLPTLFRDRGYQTTLVTDERQLVALADVAAFHECVQLGTPLDVGESRARANDISKTELARTFATVSEIVAHRRPVPQMVWAHARALYGPWDAPLELQQSMLDEDGPLPVEAVTPPKIELRPGGDSDEAFRYSCAYAAQVIVFDECWRSLVEALHSADGGDSWLVMVIGARGFPLGEHCRIGGVDSRLYSEQLHVPWLIRFPDARGKLARSGALTSHADVMPTLIEWIDGDASKGSATFDGLSAVTLATISSAPWRETLLSASIDGSHAFRASGWCLRDDTDGAAESTAAELYVRPDDRWEANDVAKLCPDVVERLRTAAAETLQQFALNKPLSPGAPLAAVDVAQT